MSRQKYGRTFHWPYSKCIHADDKIHMNPQIFIGENVVITEKLDGGNTLLHDGKVYARSTGQEATQAWFGFVKKYHAWKTIGVPYDFFGEDIAAKHSIEYNISEDDTYRLFAVRNISDMFESWDMVELIAEEYGFKTVPVLFKGKFHSIDEINDWFETELIKPSLFGQEREGFVMRFAKEFPADELGTYVAKYVRPNHVTTDEFWTKNWTWNNLV